MLHAQPHPGQIDGDDVIPVLFAAFRCLANLPLDAGTVQTRLSTLRFKLSVAWVREQNPTL